MARLTLSARIFMEYMVNLYRDGVKSCYVVGHSNGGVIPLLARELAQAEGLWQYGRMVEGVVTMGSPLQGIPLPRLLGRVFPMPGDVTVGSRTLERIAPHFEVVTLCLKANQDLVVPPDSQAPSGCLSQVMDGFHHLDFIAGTDLQLDATPHTIHRHLTLPAQQRKAY